MSVPVLASIQVGLPKSLGDEDASDPMDSRWVSGFCKEPVAGQVVVGRTNLEGDGQADLVNHGGLDKAICAYPADHYEAWRRELGIPDLPFGAFGENFTIHGLTEADVCIGDAWRVGPVELQVSQPRQPCWKLARRWRIMDLAAQVVANGRTGWYFRVLTEGTVSSGLDLELLARPNPGWTVERSNRVLHHEKANLRSTAELAGLTLLSASIRDSLLKRVEKLRSA